MPSYTQLEVDYRRERALRMEAEKAARDAKEALRNARAEMAHLQKHADSQLAQMQREKTALQVDLMSAHADRENAARSIERLTKQVDEWNGKAEALKLDLAAAEKAVAREQRMAADARRDADKAVKALAKAEKQAEDTRDGGQAAKEHAKALKAKDAQIKRAMTKAQKLAAMVDDLTAKLQAAEASKARYAAKARMIGARRDI